MATPSMVPYSNPGGNNQTSPLGGTGGPNRPASPMPFGSPSTGSNPFPTPQAATGSGGQSLIPQGGGNDSLYNPTSSYPSGETDIMKQLEDIYGKGTGGMLNWILQNMQGTDSAIFQQYLSSMMPAEASAKAGLNAQLGAEGVGPNSSVNAIAQGNLSSQFNAQASQFDANLMQQQEQDTIQIIESTMPDAKKEVATSGWSIFGDVMNQITGDIGNLIPGAPGNSAPPQTTAESTPGPNMSAPQLPFGNNTNMSSVPQGWGNTSDTGYQSLESLDLSMFD